MLGMLKSIFHRPDPGPTVDGVFHARFPEAFHLGAVPLDGAIGYGATGSARWLDPKSESDLKVLMCQPSSLLETDDPKVLANIDEARYRPHSDVVVYQPWREPAEGSNLRLLGALTEEMTKDIGDALAGSPVKHFYLVTGGVFPGALRAMREAMQGHRLKTLGLFWYYSGDDMTDDPSVVDELVDLCQACQVERLSLLTAAVDSVVEKRLVDGLEKMSQLRECSVFEKDDNTRYPRFRTPMLDAELKKRQPAAQ